MNILKTLFFMALGSASTLKAQVPIRQVLFHLVLEAPDQTSVATATCSLEYRGVVLAKPTARSQNSFLMRGQFALNSSIDQIQVNCNLAGYENIETSGLVVNNRFTLVAPFKQPKLVQTAAVDLDQDVATVRLKIPRFQRQNVSIDGASFIQLSTDSRDIQINSFQGEPRIPTYPQTSLLLALPLDAAVENVEVLPGPITEQARMLLVPKAEPGHGSALFDADPVFDSSTYFGAGANISILSDTRSTPITSADQNLVRIVVPLVDVGSKTSTVNFYEDLTIKVHFSHNSLCFRKTFPRDEVDRYRARQLRGLEPFILNIRDILNPCQPSVIAKAASQPTLGPNLILVTPHAFTGQVNAFVEHKENLGIRTAVLGWNGTDPNVLKTQLNQAYNLLGTNYVQWILLLGDVRSIPAFYDRSIGDINFGDFAVSAGDMFYTQFPAAGAPYLASQATRVSIGRIPAKTPEELTAVLNRIMSFEKNPPLLESYYNSPTVAGTLELDPAQPSSGRMNNFAEILEKEMAKPWLQKNFLPERIYRPDRDRGLPKFWSGQDPIDYGNSPLFHMNGTQSMIDIAWTRGTNLLVNSGHASTDEWSNPGFRFDPQRFSLFPIDRPPFIISFSCLTGLFDSETLVNSQNLLSEESPFYNLATENRYMAEQLILNSRGSLGVIAATRKTLVSLNNSMVRGFSRAVIGKVDKDNNPLPQDWGRLLNFAKNYSKEELGYPDNSKILRHQFLVYNLLGDPSLEFKQTPPMKLLRFGQPVYDSTAKTLRLPFLVGSSACSGCDLALQPDAEIAVLRNANNAIVSRAVVRKVRSSAGENREIVWENVQSYYGDLLKITVSGAGLSVQTHTIDNRIL